MEWDELKKFERNVSCEEAEGRGRESGLRGVALDLVPVARHAHSSSFPRYATPASKSGAGTLIEAVSVAPLPKHNTAST